MLLVGGALEAHEVKEHWQDDARAKIKIAADMYSLRFVAVRPLPKKAGRLEGGVILMASEDITISSLHSLELLHL